jgi:hypothetical protein
MGNVGRPSVGTPLLAQIPSTGNDKAFGGFESVVAAQGGTPYDAAASYLETN